MGKKQTKQIQEQQVHLDIAAITIRSLATVGIVNRELRDQITDLQHQLAECHVREVTWGESKWAEAADWDDDRSSQVKWLESDPETIPVEIPEEKIPEEIRKAALFTSVSTIFPKTTPEEIGMVRWDGPPPMPQATAPLWRFPDE